MQPRLPSNSCFSCLSFLNNTIIPRGNIKILNEIILCSLIYSKSETTYKFFDIFLLKVAIFQLLFNYFVIEVEDMAQ